MNLPEIARRAREIREAEDAAMFGRDTPPGADDDLDGDRPCDTEPEDEDCTVCGDALRKGMCWRCGAGIF